MCRSICRPLLLLALGGVLNANSSAQTTNIFPSTGNVGLGTTSPEAALTIVTNNNWSAFALKNYYTGAGQYAGILVEQARGTSASPTATQAGDVLGFVRFNGYGSSGFVSSAQISAMAGASNFSGSNSPGILAFSTTPSGSNGPVEAMRIASTGNVGIGTTNPGATLEVNGNVKLTSGSGASMTYPDGTTQSTAWNGVLSGGDYAESVNVSGDREEYEPGDVLVIDPASEGKFLRASAPYSTAVTGIYSTKPGVVGRRQLTARAHMKEEVPMAMTGIVPTKVSAENGPIKPGDLLVTSSKPGYAMKGTDRTQMLGAVIGKAIGHLDSGVGVIEAVVTLQ